MESLLNSIKQIFFYKNNFIVTDLEKNHFVARFTQLLKQAPFQTQTPYIAVRSNGG